jgi:hypothetical protein
LPHLALASLKFDPHRIDEQSVEGGDTFGWALGSLDSALGTADWAIGSLLGVPDGSEASNGEFGETELDGTALSVTVGTSDDTRVGSELRAFDAELGVMDGSWYVSFTVGFR